MMYHQTKFGCQGINNSEHIVESYFDHMNPCCDVEDSEQILCMCAWHSGPTLLHHSTRFGNKMFTSGEDHRRRTGRLQSRKAYHRADLKPTHSMWEMSPALARTLPYLHRLQEGLQQGLACSFVGNHEEVHQHQPYPSHQKPITRPLVPSSSTAA